MFKSISNLDGIRADQWYCNNTITLSIQVSDKINILCLSVSPYLNEIVLSQKVRIEYNGQTLAEYNLVENKQHKLIARLEANEADATIKVILPNSTSPCSINKGEDQDRLGIRFHNIWIEKFDDFRRQVQDNVNWALNRTSAIKQSTDKLLTDNDFLKQIEPQSIERLTAASEALDFKTDSFNTTADLNSRDEFYFLKKMNEWYYTIEEMDRNIRLAHNYSFKNRTKNYAMSKSLLSYEDIEYSSEIEEIRLNNLSLNSHEIKNNEIVLASTPPHMFFSQNNNCNIHCQMCYQSNFPFYKNIVDDEVLEIIFEYLPFCNYLLLNGSGEPLLAPHFPIFAKVTNTLKINTGLTTNGTLLWKKEQNSGLMKSINISYDGATEEVFESMRTGANFQIVQNGIKCFTEKYPDTIINFSTTISKLNLHELSKIVEQGGEFGVTKIFMCAIREFPELELTQEDFPLFVSEKEQAEQLANRYQIILDINIHEEDFKQQNSCQPENEQALIKNEVFCIEKFNSYLKKSFDLNFPLQMNKEKVQSKSLCTEKYLINQELGSVVEAQKQNLQNISINSLRHKPHCVVPWNLLFVKEDGSVKLCGNSDRVMGDLKKNSISEIKNNPQFTNARKAMLKGNELLPECISCRHPLRELGANEIFA